MISSITLTDAADLAAIANTDWPRLALIAVRNMRCTNSLHREVKSQLQCLAGLQLQLGPAHEIWDDKLDSTAVFLVKQQLMQPGQQASFDLLQLTTASSKLASPPQLDRLATTADLYSSASSPQLSHLTAAFRYLQKPQYAALRNLTLSHNSLDADSLAQLVTIDWPTLRKLNVSHNNLDASAIACLAKAFWPELDNLDVAACGLDKAAMIELVQCQWHKLSHINLSANPDLDHTAIALPYHSAWGWLNGVSLQCKEVSPSAVRSLTQLQSSHEILGLQICWAGLETASLLVLAQTFENLRSLSLTGNCLRADYGSLGHS